MSPFEAKRLRNQFAAKEEEVRELRGLLSSTELRLDGDATELRVSLEREHTHREEAERLFDHLYADRDAQAGALRDIYLQINDAMATVGLPPFVPYGMFDERKLDHLAIFFRYLARELGGPRLRMEVALDEEGERAADAVAARILACVHHYDPDIPVEMVLDDLNSEE